MKKAHNLIYNFIPADLKQEYHIYIAKMLLKRSNSNENPKPSSIFDMGIQFYRGNSLQNALLCFYHYGEYLYSLGSQKESLRIFEKAYNICNILFQKKLNVDLNEIKYTTFDETFSVRFSLREMHNLVEGSNLILRTIISTLIRLGQCLVSYDRTRASAIIYPQAIQLFMSARVNNSLKLDKTHMNVSGQIVTATDVDCVNSNRLLCCQLAGSDFKFVEKTTLLVREAQSNIGLIIFHHYQ
jgi:tetratricopeptide (TPR) repeat protein